MDHLLNTAPCGFVSFADDGSVLAANATLLGMLDYTADDVIGRHIERLFAVGTRIFYQTHWFPLLRMHGHAEEVFLMMRARSGENVGVLSYAKRRSNTEAGVYDCVLVHVRERAKYEDELLRAKRAAEEATRELQKQQRALRDANDELEAQAVELEFQQQQSEELRALAEDANRAKSAFLATMSHELRTPLNAISGYLEILEMGIPGPLSEAQRDIVSRLDQSSRHLLRLINEVLNLARIESGHVEYDIRDIPAGHIVAGVKPMIEPQFANKRIRFSVDVPPDLMVRVDLEKTEQILLNLLSNAMKFTAAGGSVELRAAASESGDQVALYVRDSGIGIPHDKLQSVFEPFVQVKSGESRTSEGTGLGLAISRDLARGMSGDLWAASVVGEGSTFTLVVPAATAS